MCHNEVRDLTTNLLTEVCHQVITEPDLQSLSTETFVSKSTNTQDGARLDIAVDFFWEAIGGTREGSYREAIGSTREGRRIGSTRKHERGK